MLVVAGTIPIKAEMMAEAVAAAQIMAAKTNEEDGCISYGFFVSINDANTILVFEEWESEAHLQAHFVTDHMAEFRKVLPSVVAGPGTISKYMVSEHGPL